MTRSKNYERFTIPLKYYLILVSYASMSLMMENLNGIHNIWHSLTPYGITQPLQQSIIIHLLINHNRSMHYLVKK